MGRHDYPAFTRIYARLSRMEEGGPVGAARTEIARSLSGRLLIIGLGPGIDLGHLPAAVTEVVAVEPSASMRRAAEENVAAARARGLAVEVLDAVGEDLPLADRSADSALCAFVLCSVSDPAAVLAEVRRVLRPGGRVGVLEHVAGGSGSAMRLAQRLASPLWPHVAGGCHCDRDTRSVLVSAGFDTEGVRDTRLVPLPPVAPALVGVAISPTD